MSSSSFGYSTSSSSTSSSSSSTEVRSSSSSSNSSSSSSYYEVLIITGNITPDITGEYLYNSVSGHYEKGLANISGSSGSWILAAGTTPAIWLNEDISVTGSYNPILGGATGIAIVNWRDIISSSSSSISSDSYSISSDSSLSSSSSSSADIIKIYSGDTYTYDQDNNYTEFKYMDGDLTFATMILGSTSFLIGNYGGKFIWDYNGSNEFIFDNIGDVFVEEINLRTYTIEFLGYGSLWFSVSAVESDNKSIPFIFETEQINPIWTIIANGEDVYAGTGSEGIILKSTDRTFWSKIYTVDDYHVTALLVQDNKLYAGTSPRGNIYTIDLSTNVVRFSQQIGGTIHSFIYFNDNLYAAGGSPSQIYVYNPQNSKWDIFYKPYGGSVSKMLIFNSKMYVFLDGPNFISFDGNKWSLEGSGVDNASSFRNVVTEPFSFTSNNLISRSEIRSIDNFNTEDIYDIFPMNYSRGFSAADIDGNSLVLGTDDNGKIYSYANNNMFLLFETEAQNKVYSVLNIEPGVNLAAIDNKLYLVHAGDLPKEASIIDSSDVITTTTTSTAIPAPSGTVIVVESPQSGDSYAVGDTVNITWASTKGINEAVQIDLYKGGVLSLTISSKTSNKGTFTWTVPTILPSNDFAIVVTWLTPGKTDPQNQGISGIFSLTTIATTTTTTTTSLVIQSNVASIVKTSGSRGIPILELEDEYITTMIRDETKGGILFATSRGRLLNCYESLFNAYLTGERNVYAEVRDGLGNTSDTAYTSFFYALYNKIVEINEDKEIIRWRFENKPDAITNDRITGIFLSPVLSVKQDLVEWKQLIWRETKPSNTDIVICVRSADTTDLLKQQPWDNCFVSRDSDRGYGSTGLIIRDLNLRGKYIQFKTTMTTDERDITPVLLSLSVTYSTKFALYFFTTKFALQKSSNVKRGLFVANMTEPQYTEVKFGVANKNTSDWNDYSVVGVNKFFDINSFQEMKVGIKMIAYDDNVPEVAEFSLLTGADINNQINEI
jgi:hypothetical protein